MRKAQNSVCVGAALLLRCAAAQADDDVSVTPYRPSVSTPAQLSAPGWIEGEFGLQRVHGGDSARSDSLPYTIKLAFTPDWGVRIGGDAYVRNTDFDGNRTSGVGDTSIVLKRRFAMDDGRARNAAFGLEAGANLPTAKSGLGSGKTDYSINGIYSADFGDWHTDLNLVGARLGQVEADQSRWQTTWAAALSRPLSDRLGIVGEFSGTYQRGAATTSQFLAAASFSVSKRAVVDFGASAGLSAASPDWSAFAGMTLLLCRLF